jgi:hypothetical protein
MVAFEDFGLGKIPRNTSAALSTYILLRTEWSASVGKVLADRKAAVREASNTQRANDADAIQVLAGKGDLAAVADVFKSNRLAEAEADLAKAERAHQAVRDATAGQIRYLGRLVATEDRDAFEDMLATAWRSTIVVTTPDTTLRELEAAEIKSTTGKDLIGRLLIFLESVSGADNADKQLIRAALKQERPDLPTLAVIERERAEAAANSPEARRRQEAERKAADAKARRSAEVAISAAYRRTGKPPVQNTATDSVEDNEAPTGQGGK